MYLSWTDPESVRAEPSLTFGTALCFNGSPALHTSRSPPMIFSDAELASLNTNPLYYSIGIRVEAVGDGAGRSVLDPQPAVCWPTPGRPHGGVLFTVLDTTMAFAAISNGAPGTGCATVDCSIQYTAPADHGPFRCEVSTTSKTSRTVFIRGQVSDRNGTLVALAQGTFRLFPVRAA